MLIDGNAYIGHWPFVKYEYNTLDALLGRMNEFGTELSVISSLNGVFYKNTQWANEELWGQLRGKQFYQSRFIPFAVINPIYAGWRKDFDVCIHRYKMRGVRIYPRYHRYDLDHPFCIELARMCRDEGIPLAVSLRMVDSRTSSWLDLEKEWSLQDAVPIIRAVPDAKFMILNLANNLSLDKEGADLFSKAELLLDTSGRLMEDMVDLISRFGSDKICFGTHSPLLDYSAGLLRIEALGDEEADEAVKEKMRSGNLRRMLNI